MQIEPPRPPSRPARDLAGGGWMLVAGCALAAVGIATGAQGTQGTQDPPPPPTQAHPSFTAIGTSDSNSRMIAATGIDITGASILYLVDTVDPHIAVYQANGGSTSTQGMKLVAARRIDLDLRLDGFNDRSEQKYKDLEGQFIKSGLLPADR